MGSHVRRQLLVSKKGQAMVEILPALMIFLIVLTSGLAYFRVMRSAVIRQELVRNAMFAAIHNSGSLTTPANLTRVPSGESIGSGVMMNSAGPLIAGPRMAFIDNQTNCFRVLPKDPILSVDTPILESLLGAGNEQPLVKISTYAVIHRVYDPNARRNCVMSDNGAVIP